MRRRVLSLLLAVCMVLGMLPMSALAADIPGETNISRITGVTEITESDPISFSMWGMDYSAPACVAQIPAGTETVTVTFASGTHPNPYADSSTGMLKLSGCWAVWSEENVAYSGSGVDHDCVQGEDGLYSIELDAAAMIEENRYYGAYDTSYGVQYLLGFVYGEEDTSNDKPFLSIAIDGEALAEDAITFRSLFDLGSLESSYSYIHEDVPYYHITVPCGTAYVDVTYSADTNIFDYGTDAYGYATELTVDAVSSATVKGRTFQNAYTLNDDGTQTVKTPVTGYTFDADGNGMAVTLEEEGDTYEAVCLFSFEYDGKEHVYTAQVTAPTCTEKGCTTYTCTCGDTYTEEIGASGHIYEDGICTVCGNATQIASGECGENLSWTLSGDGVLTISGTGGMTVISAKDASPWYSYAADITAVVLPEGMTDISKYSFYGCTGLKSVTIPGTVTSVGTSAFSECSSLEQVEIGEAVTKIGDYAFYNTSLKNVVLPDSVTSIGGSSFRNIEELEAVRFSNNLTTIGSYAFFNCINLKTAEIPSGVTKIEGMTFQQCYALESVSLPDALTSIGSSAFRYCRKLESIEIPQSVTSISNDAFGESGLKSIVIPDAVTTPSQFALQKAFLNCTALETAVLGSGMTQINTSMFEGCTALKSIVIPASVTAIKNTVFSGCTSLTEIVFEGEAPSFGTNVFRNVVATVTYPCGDSWTESVRKAYGGTIEWVNVHHHELTETPATCTEDGLKTFTCPCGDTYTEVIFAEGHNYADQVCTVCGAAEPVPEQDENGVYQIENAEDLLWFAEAVNGGNNTIGGALTADIDLSETDWPGIGASSSKFAGSFDGRNHTVTFRDSLHGLFAYTRGTSDAYVQIQNVITEGTLNDSAIVSDAIYTAVTNCINRADISGGANTGGIVGYVNNDGWQGNSGVTITNCANEGDITGDTNVGGILGYAQVRAQVIGCSNSGAISGTSCVGGIAGYIQEYKSPCEIVSCYNLGTVTGTGYVGGIAGDTHNGVSITSCYNAGQCTYGITGFIYDNTVTITNCYFQGTKSEKGVPDNTYTNVSVESKTAAEMSSEEFATLLGDAFLTSCPAPVLTWQTASDHTGMEDEVCDVCGFGSDAKETYAVTVTADEGTVVTGEETAADGESYSFTVTVSDGYEATDSFTVKVNGETLEAVDGVYIVETVTGPVSITVTGVQKIPESYAVTLPGTGNGYRVNGEAAAARGENYTFTVTFVEGFQAGEDFLVKANDVELTAVDGVYTIESVLREQTITVSGVELIPGSNTVDVNLTVTYGEDTFYTASEIGTILLDQDMTVPYFDLSLYDLEGYYYNPNCYLDNSGNLVVQGAGNTETAYGVVTTMHAFIWATEIYYLGMDPADAGTGASNEMDTDGDGTSDFAEAVSWSGGAGSSFMNLWDHGTNLNYYLNYVYPLAYEGWGSTADQEALADGDVISIHLIEDKSVSGSNFAVITAEDSDKVFSQADTKDKTTVTQGAKLDLTLYQTVNTGKYDTEYANVASQALYWIEADSVTEEIELWNRTDFGTMTAEELVTDSTGTVTIDTAGLEPGTYYIGARGGLTAGGAQDNAGFVSRGGETGAAFFKLTVLERQTGDLDADGTVSEAEAAAVAEQYRGQKALTEEELANVDADGNGIVSLTEAAAVIRNSKK